MAHYDHQLLGLVVLPDAYLKNVLIVAGGTPFQFQNI